MLRDDDDEDEDLQRFLDSLAVFHLRTVPLIVGIIVVIDMLGHINEGENEHGTIAFVSVYQYLWVLRNEHRQLHLLVFTNTFRHYVILLFYFPRTFFIY